MNICSRFASLRLFSLIALVAVSHSAKAQTFYFQQTGFSGSGVINGTFTAADLNFNGQISSFSGEVSSLFFTFTGDSLVANFSGSLINTGSNGLVYDPNNGPFLGDDLTLHVEGIASNTFNGTGFSYASGLGPTLALGGYVENNVTHVRSSSLELVRVSLTPFESVPEPSTYGLIGAGLLVGVIILRRRSY